VESPAQCGGGEIKKMQPKELIFNNDNKILLVGKYELRIFSTPQYIVKNQNIILK